MEPLWLDFANPDPVDLGHRVLNGVLIALLVSTLVAHLLIVRESEDVSRSLEAAHRTLDQAVTPTPTKTSDDEGIPPARLISLLGNLESALDDSVTVLSLAPHRDALEMSAEAKNAAAMTAFVERLQGVPSLSSLHLTDVHAVTDHPQHPVRFTLQAKWSGAKS